MTAENNHRLYRACRIKEMLQLLLKIKDTKEAEATFKRWLWRASYSRIGAFKDLYLKIKRSIRKTYGFRKSSNFSTSFY